MNLDELLLLLSNLVRPLSSELTRQQAVEFFLAFLRTGIAARRAQIFIINPQGDPVSYPADGESSAGGCDVPFDLIEQALTSRKTLTCGSDVVVPLQVQPEPFGVLVVEGLREPIDKRLWSVVGAMASGVLCAGKPPSV